MWRNSLSSYLRACVDFIVSFCSAMLHGFAGVGECCRFSPSCGAYAKIALKEHGALRGGWLTVRRLCRCHPGGNYGYDPVPQHERS